MQVEGNPVVVVNNDGKRIYNDYKNLRGDVSSKFVAIDSRMRDTNIYPNAYNFKINFEKEYKGVYSIELITAILPIPIQEGEEEGTFERVCPNTYVVMTLDQGWKIESIDSAQSTNKTDSAFYADIFDNAFAVIPLVENHRLEVDSTANPAVSYSYWERDSLRFIKRFMPKKESIKGLHIQLFTPDPTSFNSRRVYYPGPNSEGDTELTDQVYLLFEIVSQD
jgi:hypothetical protein